MSRVLLLLLAKISGLHFGLYADWICEERPMDTIFMLFYSACIFLQSRNGISVNGHPLDRTDLLALKNGDQVILTNETVAVYKFFEQRPQNTGISETTSAARANNKSGQERVADMTGSTSTKTTTTTRIKKQVRIMSRDDE